jgi:hypothetical protein
VQPGVAQHFGDNVLDIVSYLIASPESKLAHTKPFPRRKPPICACRSWGQRKGIG